MKGTLPRQLLHAGSARRNTLFKKCRVLNQDALFFWGGGGGVGGGGREEGQSIAQLLSARRTRHRARAEDQLGLVGGRFARGSDKVQAIGDS